VTGRRRSGKGPRSQPTLALYDAKCHYVLWRPVTAIEFGNTIGNPGITGDPTWLPLLVTEY
jgi:hypothetical protein